MSDLTIDFIKTHETTFAEHAVNSPNTCLEETIDRVGVESLSELSASIDSPTSSSLNADRMTQPLTPSSTKIKDAAQKILESNPTSASLNAVLNFEAACAEKLRNQEIKTNDLLMTTDLLLNLSAEIAALPSSANVEISVAMKGILNELKGKGIDLLAGDPAKITKEQLIELKSAIGSRIDKSRTQIQQIFTKMQTLIQNMMSVNDSGKRIISEFTQMIRTIIKNMRS